jgi:putative ABC transport system ATP-binding protein
MNKSLTIKINNLNKSFGTGEAHTQILKDINLEIFSGEFIIFFGPSGCGKSTLLNCICGLEIPDSGQILIRGEDLSELEKSQLAKYRNKKIGIIFQQFNILKSFNVLENVALPQAFCGISHSRRIKRAFRLLEMLGIEKLARRIPTEISGGQQQKVAIARALVNNPWIIVADEPTGNLDSNSAQEVMTLIENLNIKSKRTVLLVTHNPEHLKYAHRIFYLKDGQIVKEETNKKISQQEDKELEEIVL